MNPSAWIGLVLPIASAVRDLVVLFQKDYGRGPTDDELAALITARQAADEAWEAVYRRMKTQL